MPAYWGARWSARYARRASAIWALFAQTGIDLGIGQTSFDERHHTWGSAIFAEVIGTAILMFAILGIVDKRSPGDFAGIVIGGVVVAIIMVDRPDHRRVAQPGARVRPGARDRDRRRHDVQWNQIIPVYVLPGLVGAALAAFAYDFLATPRKVERPIRDAVTHPDPAASASAAK